MDNDSIVVLLQGFQKKSQKTPLKEIQLAERLRKEYFKEKKGLQYGNGEKRKNFEVFYV